jgi:peptide deformylase
MITLMDDANGVGLAGNQVGLLRRVLVYRPDREDAEPRALVNPVISERSEETATDEEGCLSLGPLRVPVERNVRVSVDAQDEHGEPVHVNAEHLEARILQHEIDHLDGVLTIDRTSPESRREALAALRPPPGPRR